MDWGRGGGGGSFSLDCDMLHPAMLMVISQCNIYITRIYIQPFVAAAPVYMYIYVCLSCRIKVYLCGYMYSVQKLMFI